MEAVKHEGPPGRPAPGGRDALPPDDEKRARVRAMFDRIAPRYDLLNRALTGGLDQRWRRRALRHVGVGADDLVLDIACGTGDLAELAGARGAHVIGADFAGNMLHGARARGVDADFVQGDAAQLPLCDACVSVVTCGFALRNFVALDAVLEEFARVLRPGGRLALIEVDRPRSALVRAGHSLYFDRVVPWIGGLVSDREAYRYLPQSTAYLPPPEQLLAMIEHAGFERVERQPLLLGAAQIVTAVRTSQATRAGRAS